MISTPPPTNGDRSNPDVWVDCAPGELRNLADRLQSRRQAVTARRRAAWGVAIISFVAVGFVAFGVLSPQQPALAGLNCAEVFARMDDYIAGTLSGEQRDLVAQHLEECPNCRRELDSRRQNAGSATAIDAPRSEIVHRPELSGEFILTAAAGVSTGY